MTALRDQLAKYDALISRVEMSDYGYWQVTYSVAPGLSLSVTVCQTGIDREQACELGHIALSLATGQRVRGQ